MTRFANRLRRSTADVSSLSVGSDADDALQFTLDDVLNLLVDPAAAAAAKKPTTSTSPTASASFQMNGSKWLQQQAGPRAKRSSTSHSLHRCSSRLSTPKATSQDAGNSTFDNQSDNDDNAFDHDHADDDNGNSEDEDAAKSRQRYRRRLAWLEANFTQIAMSYYVDGKVVRTCVDAYRTKCHKLDAYVNELLDEMSRSVTSAFVELSTNNTSAQQQQQKHRSGATTTLDVDELRRARDELVKMRGHVRVLRHSANEMASASGTLGALQQEESAHELVRVSLSYVRELRRLVRSFEQQQQQQQQQHQHKQQIQQQQQQQQQQRKLKQQKSLAADTSNCCLDIACCHASQREQATTSNRTTNENITSTTTTTAAAAAIYPHPASSFRRHSEQTVSICETQRDALNRSRRVQSVCPSLLCGATRGALLTSTNTTPTKEVLLAGNDETISKHTDGYGTWLCNEWTASWWRRQLSAEWTSTKAKSRPPRYLEARLTISVFIVVVSFVLLALALVFDSDVYATLFELAGRAIYKH